MHMVRTSFYTKDKSLFIVSETNPIYLKLFNLEGLKKDLNSIVMNFIAWAGLGK